MLKLLEEEIKGGFGKWRDEPPPGPRRATVKTPLPPRLVYRVNAAPGKTQARFCSDTDKPTLKPQGDASEPQYPNL